MLGGKEGYHSIGDDAASVSPSRGVSDITGVELGSVISGDIRADQEVPQENKHFLQIIFSFQPLLGAPTHVYVFFQCACVIFNL